MGPKSARVYRTIREWVASGKLQPGEKLPSERTLEKVLDIGRTQLRTVLAKFVAWSTGGTMRSPLTSTSRSKRSARPSPPGKVRRRHLAREWHDATPPPEWRRNDQGPGSRFDAGDLGLCHASCWWARTVSNRRHPLCKFNSSARVEASSLYRTTVCDCPRLLVSAVVDVSVGCQRPSSSRIGQ
ncbi:GntR family transcriptional regulator [Streptomyces sp. NPDC057460]|uniref:GntR family transcriptional regulator n=1 Tax=Streptomyces sp. NPDC057460 TaxID=3346141 RepID=UPI0036BEFD34